MNEENQLIVNKIAKGLEETIKKTEEFIIETFPAEFSYDLLTKRKYKITHDYDPPWDSSGEVFVDLDNIKFNLSDYKTVGDFFEEYTGNWEATFMSGYGKHHTRYGDKYEGWFEELFCTAHYDYFNSVSNHALLILAKDIFSESYVEKYNDDIAQLIFDLCEEIEEFEDVSIFKANEMLEKVIKMDSMFVYKRGEKQANERLLHEKREAEEKRKQEEIERESFRRLWSLLEKKYKILYQKPIPKRMEKPEYILFRRFLDQQNIPKKERELIAKYAPVSFSNSVMNELRK